MAEQRLLADHAEQHLVAALVGDGDARHAGLELEKLAGDGEGGRGGGVVRLVRMRLRPFDQFLDGLCRIVHRHHHDQRKIRDHRQRNKGLGRMVGELRQGRRGDRHHAAGAHHQGIAIGRLARDVFRRDPAAGAGLVLDHDRLLEDVGELLPDQARENVVAATGGEADDDADRLVRESRRGVTLRRCRPGGHGGKRHQRRRQQTAFETDHWRSSVRVCL